MEEGRKTSVSVGPCSRLVAAQLLTDGARGKERKIEEKERRERRLGFEQQGFYAFLSLLFLSLLLLLLLLYIEKKKTNHGIVQNAPEKTPH